MTTSHGSKDDFHLEEMGDYKGRMAELSDGYTVTFESIPAGMGGPDLFKGLPDDACQSPHWGYLFKGKFKATYTRRERGRGVGRRGVLPATTKPWSMRTTATMSQGSHRSQMEQIECSIAFERLAALVVAAVEGANRAQPSRAPPGLLLEVAAELEDVMLARCPSP